MEKSRLCPQDEVQIRAAFILILVAEAPDWLIFFNASDPKMKCQISVKQWKKCFKKKNIMEIYLQKVWNSCRCKWQLFKTKLTDMQINCYPGFNLFFSKRSSFTPGRRDSLEPRQGDTLDESPVHRMNRQTASRTHPHT